MKKIFVRILQILMMTGFSQAFASDILNEEERPDDEKTSSSFSRPHEQEFPSSFKDAVCHVPELFVEHFPSHLPLSDLLTFSATCRDFRKIFYTGPIFRRLFPFQVPGCPIEGILVLTSLEDFKAYARKTNPWDERGEPNEFYDETFCDLRVTVKDTELSDEGLRLLDQARHLSFKGCEASEASPITHFSSHLKSLEFWPDPSLFQASTSFFSGHSLGLLPRSLTYLSLEKGHLTGAGFKILLPNLTHLLLKDFKLYPGEDQDIFPQSLRHLMFNGTTPVFSDKLLTYLPQGLEVLLIGNCGSMTDSGLLTLPSSLKRLSLGCGAHITDQGLARLRKANKDLKIVGSCT